VTEPSGGHRGARTSPEQSAHRKSLLHNVTVRDLQPTHATMQRRYGEGSGRPWLWPIGMCCVLAVCVARVRAHPQCLDFKPPYRPPRELEFCVMYKEFGCCDYQRDQELMTKYYHVMGHFDESGYATCAGFVQELLCQVGIMGKGRLAHAP